MDDPKFSNMTGEQKAWYSLMIAADHEREMEHMLSYLEYLAAFTNSEGVKKQKEWRESQKEGAVKEAEDFIESSKSNEFKNNPLFDAIKKIRDAEAQAKQSENIFNSINLNKLISGDI